MNNEIPYFEPALRRTRRPRVSKTGIVVACLLAVFAALLFVSQAHAQNAAKHPMEYTAVVKAGAVISRDTFCKGVTKTKN